MLLRFLLVAATGLPLTGSAPITSATLGHAVQALQVEIVGDDLFAGLSLIVTAIAAIVGLVAAVASWKAASAARDAAQTGKQAAEHAEKAADAALDSAKYERKTFETAREHEESAQARMIFISWREVTSYGGKKVSVSLQVENRSTAPISEVTLWGECETVRVTETHSLDHVEPEQKPRIDVKFTPALPESYDSPGGRGAVIFVDANGQRWLRRSGDTPKKYPA